MLKKVFYSVFIAIICCAGGLFLYTWIKSAEASSHIACAFCDKQIVNGQKFYEDDLLVVLCTHKPIVPSHFLIVPKRHIERLEMLSEEEILRVHQIISDVNYAAAKVFQTSSYLIHQKNGREVGQSVPHVHFHFLAKRSGDTSSFKFFVQMLLAYLKGPISSEEMQKVIEKMKRALEENAPSPIFKEQQTP